MTAVDGSPIAVEILRERASAQNLNIDRRVADLGRSEFEIEPGAYDLICDCYYFQRGLTPKIKSGLRPGGIIIAIVHLADADQPHGTPTRARSGELPALFEGWKILYQYEGKSHEACHQRPVAELVARKPAG